MMLANGALCRVGAPKTCARGLPQLARFLHRTLLSRSASNQPAIRALSRAYASVLEARRSYATTTSATKPTATVTKAVKAKAASKAPPKTKATAKTAKTTKSPATKKAASKAKPKAKAKKTKAAPKKPAAKKRVTKVLAPEAKEKLLIKELRKTALKEPVSTHQINAYNCFLGDQLKGTGQEGTTATRLVNASRKFKEVTPAELEHYNHLARERTAANRAKYRTWIESHTPQQIHDANNARKRLRRLLKTGAGKRKTPAHTMKLVDDRQPKGMRTSFGAFCAERHLSGDFKGITVAESAKLAAEEWKALSEGEKKKYLDLREADKARYEREKAAAY